jgi:radical SAM protein with 4Fe4S-binding SPASM domain
LDFTHPKIEVQDKWDFSNRASNNRGGALTGLPMAAQASDSPCANPFGHLVIMPPGVAVLCCSDGFKQYPTGDIRKQTLQQIWHGEAFRRVRRLLATGRRSQISPCSGCSVAGGCFLEYFQEPERYSDMIHQYGLP